jgi:hypothetical protein
MSGLQFYFETMAGTHLEDSLRALRDSGSADALYAPSLLTTDPDAISYEDFSIARDEAHGWRVAYCRRALLFAAFAAEAYANDFLYERWGGQDRDGLDRLSTVDKYAFLPALAGTAVLLNRGEEPLQKIRWLFDRRNELVHPKPRGEPSCVWRRL